jgi:HSP20 family protein
MATTLSPQKASGSLARRDAFSPFRKEMDEMLANFWGTAPSIWTSATLSPAVDLSEQENTFIMKVDVPGLNAKDFNVQIQGDTVIVSGEREEEKETKDKTYYRMERRQGSFSRSVTLPCSINADEVAADYVNGVLTLTLPKAEQSKAKKIAVKG